MPQVITEDEFMEMTRSGEFETDGNGLFVELVVEGLQSFFDKKIQELMNHQSRMMQEARSIPETIAQQIKAIDVRPAVQQVDMNPILKAIAAIKIPEPIVHTGEAHGKHKWEFDILRDELGRIRKVIAREV